MSKLAAFLLIVFTSCFDFIAKYFSRKVAIGATSVAAMLSVTTAFYLTIKGLVNFSVSQITNEYLLMGFYACWPDNADACIAICLSADVIAFMYRYNTDLLKIFTTSN